MKSEDYRAEGYFDMIFIDGDHTYQGLKTLLKTDPVSLRRMHSHNLIENLTSEDLTLTMYARAQGRL